MEFLTPERRDEMIEELEEIQGVMKQADGILIGMGEPIKQKQGITSAVVDAMVHQMLRDWESERNG